MLHKLKVGVPEDTFLKIHVLEGTRFPFFERTEHLACIVVRMAMVQTLDLTAVDARASVSSGIGLNES